MLNDNIWWKSDWELHILETKIEIDEKNTLSEKKTILFFQ